METTIRPAGMAVPGEYLVVNEPREIQMTWVWLAKGEPEVQDRVRVQFTATDNEATLVTVTHHVTRDLRQSTTIGRGWAMSSRGSPKSAGAYQTAPSTPPDGSSAAAFPDLAGCDACAMPPGDAEGSAEPRQA